jgi:single-strand DNA-binding protein
MFHKIIIVGNLGSDPEMRYTADGTPVTNLSVATKETVSKDKVPNCPKGWKESYNGKNWELTTWFRVSVWRGQAEACNSFLKKGSQVYIEATLKGEADNGTQNPRVWTSGDGTPKASFEVNARNLLFLGGKNGSSGGQGDVTDEEAPPIVGSGEF